MGTLREDKYTFFIISRSTFLGMRNFSDTHCRENRNTTSKKNYTVYEIICKNTVEPGRPQMTILRMRITSWLSKARTTRSQYVIVVLFAFPQQHLLHERALMLRYTYIAVLTIIRTLMVVSICAIIRCGFHVAHTVRILTINV